MFRFPIVLFTFLLSVTAMGSVEISGIVCREKKTMGLYLQEDGSCIPVVFLNTIAQGDFSTLAEGDAVTVSGNILSRPVKIEADSVLSIGLVRLLGTWKDTLGRYIRFDTFNDVMFYDPTKPATKIIKYDYEIYPNEKHTWGMLLSTKMIVKAATLVQTKTRPLSFELCISDKADAKNFSCSTLNKVSD